MRDQVEAEEGAKKTVLAAGAHAHGGSRIKGRSSSLLSGGGDAFEWRKLMTAVFFLALTGLSTAHAQLGPKDGANFKPTDLDRIRIGARAPDFTLEDTNGRRLSLSDFRREKNVVLVFYRGRW
jgi:hypothetical protein